MTIDDFDIGYAETGDSWEWGPFTLGGYAGEDGVSDFRYHEKGNGSATATWQFTGLATGYVEVYAIWPGGGKSPARNAPFTIFDGDLSGSLLATVAVNQGDASPTGGEYLGTFVITGDTLTVQLNNKATGFVKADAVRIVSLASSSSSQTSKAAATVFEQIACEQAPLFAPLGRCSSR